MYKGSSWGGNIDSTHIASLRKWWVVVDMNAGTYSTNVKKRLSLSFTWILELVGEEGTYLSSGDPPFISESGRSAIEINYRENFNAAIQLRWFKQPPSPFRVWEGDSVQLRHVTIRFSGSKSWEQRASLTIVGSELAMSSWALLTTLYLSPSSRKEE